MRVDGCRHPLLFTASFRAVDTTIRPASSLDTVANDLAAAVVANGRERVDRAFETVERVTLSLGNNFERRIVVVAADLAT
jgi:hypothetical protein